MASQRRDDLVGNSFDIERFCRCNHTPGLYAEVTESTSRRGSGWGRLDARGFIVGQRYRRSLRIAEIVQMQPIGFARGERRDCGQHRHAQRERTDCRRDAE